jgi:hypothetical protein
MVEGQTPEAGVTVVALLKHYNHGNCRMHITNRDHGNSIQFLRTYMLTQKPKCHYRVSRNREANKTNTYTQTRQKRQKVPFKKHVMIVTKLVTVTQF